MGIFKKEKTYPQQVNLQTVVTQFVDYLNGDGWKVQQKVEGDKAVVQAQKGGILRDLIAADRGVWASSDFHEFVSNSLLFAPPIMVGVTTFTVYSCFSIFPPLYKFYQNSFKKNYKIKRDLLKALRLSLLELLYTLLLRNDEP